MNPFKERDVSERLNAAAEARQAMLDKLKAKLPKADDPAFQARQAERVKIAEARDARIAERKAAKEAARLAAEAEARRAAEEEAERAAAAKRAESDMIAKLLADQKAARDARYAARKARLKK